MKRLLLAAKLAGALYLPVLICAINDDPFTYIIYSRPAEWIVGALRITW